MGHIDLRDLDDDDLDAIFETMRDRRALARAAFAPADPDDRVAFDEWMLRQRTDSDVTLSVITEDGGFAGTAAAFSLEGRREVTAWVAPHATGRGVGPAALRLLVAREPERPLYARMAAHDEASVALLTKLGFIEVSGSEAFGPPSGPTERVYALPPTLE